VIHQRSANVFPPPRNWQFIWIRNLHSEIDLSVGHFLQAELALMASCRLQSDMLPVEKMKYTIWAANTERAVAFYRYAFGAEVVKQNPHITELEIAGGVISIHGGGEGKKTWTGITLQIPDVVEGAAVVRKAGGQCPREPEPEDGEPAHLAMCIDTEGNEIMLTRARS
jgi:predicted enzyme related to lactoylglutathione lyase